MISDIDTFSQINSTPNRYQAGAEPKDVCPMKEEIPHPLKGMGDFVDG